MHVEKARNADLVFVVSAQNRPLMPCRPQTARRLLCQGKAKVISKTPFTIRLRYGSTGYVQKVTAGMDTGSKKLGSAASSDGRVLYQAEIELRSDITSKMQQRRAYRRSRRSRKTRYRPARFDNRGKSEKLAPSIKSKVESHFREKKHLESLLPIQHWNIELASFDIHKISNPQVSKKNGWTYQAGNQKDFYNLKAYILHRDKHTCQQCRKSWNLKLQVHHIQFRSQGGTDSPANLVTLCDLCHDRLHQGKLKDQAIEALRKIAGSKTKDATEIGIIKSRIKKSGWKFREVFGFETKFRRERELFFPKSHAYDAIAISSPLLPIRTIPTQLIIKKHVAAGDYQQTAGRRSEKRIPTGKLFGLRKFDMIQTSKGIGFIKGKRSTGYFAVTHLDGTKLHDSINVKKNALRLRARTSTLIALSTFEGPHVH